MRQVLAAFRQEEKYADRDISLRFRTHCDSDSGVISPQAHSVVGRSSGVGTGGSGGSMNRGPRAPGPPSSGATEIFLGKTLRKIIKIVATDDGF